MFDANYEGRVNTCGNILFQPKPHYPWSHLKKNPYASSVMPKSLVAPVARATPLSLLCICCVLHAKVHPQRSARVARFARSLAARQRSDFQTSKKSIKINKHHNKNVENVERRAPRTRQTRAVLDASWAPSWRHLGGSWRHLGPSWRHLGTSWRHLGRSWRHFGRILASQKPPKIAPKLQRGLPRRAPT